MKALFVGVVMVMAMARPAEAGRGVGVVVFNTGEDILDLGPVTNPDHEITGELGSSLRLGYKYDLFGLFWVDLFRWGGEYVLHDGDQYIPLTDDIAHQLGASMPWGYYLAPGLVLIAVVIVFFVVTRRRRSSRLLIGLGGAWLVLALLMWRNHASAWPLVALLGAHHVIGVRWFLRFGGAAPDSEDHAIDVEPEPAPEPRRSRPAVVTRPPIAGVESDPFRAPPQQAPLVIERPSAPAPIPMVVDDNAERPKLLG